MTDFTRSIHLPKDRGGCPEPRGGLLPKVGTRSFTLPKSPRGLVSDRCERDNDAEADEERRCSMTTHKVWTLIAVLVVSLLMVVGSQQSAVADDLDDGFTCFEIKEIRDHKDKHDDEKLEVKLTNQFHWKKKAELDDPVYLCAPSKIKVKDRDHKDLLAAAERKDFDHLKCFKIDDIRDRDKGLYKLEPEDKDFEDELVKVKKAKLVCIFVHKKPAYD